jgi:hypothetical protein
MSALRPREIGELAGRTQGSQAMHACPDEILAETRKNICFYFAGGVNG